MHIRCRRVSTKSILCLGAKHSVVAYRSVSWTARMKPLVCEWFQGAKPTGTCDLAGGSKSFCPSGIANLLGKKIAWAFQPQVKAAVETKALPLILGPWTVVKQESTAPMLGWCMLAQWAVCPYYEELGWLTLVRTLTTCSYSRSGYHG